MHACMLMCCYGVPKSEQGTNLCGEVIERAHSLFMSIEISNIYIIYVHDVRVSYVDLSRIPRKIYT